MVANSYANSLFIFLVSSYDGPCPLPQPAEMYSAFVKVKLDIAEKSVLSSFSTEIYQDEHGDASEQQDCDRYAEQLVNVSSLGRANVVKSLEILGGALSEKVGLLQSVCASASLPDGMYLICV